VSKSHLLETKIKEKMTSDHRWARSYPQVAKVRKKAGINENILLQRYGGDVLFSEKKTKKGGDTLLWSVGKREGYSELRKRTHEKGRKEMEGWLSVREGKNMMGVGVFLNL